MSRRTKLSKPQSNMRDVSEKLRVWMVTPSSSVTRSAPSTTLIMWRLPRKADEMRQ